MTEWSLVASYTVQHRLVRIEYSWSMYGYYSVQEPGYVTIIVDNMPIYTGYTG